MTSAAVKTRQSRWLVLLFFVAICWTAPAIASLAGGMPGDWYRTLRKPDFTPPGWLFGPVWSALYTLMALAAWRTWRYGHGRPRWMALVWFFVQLSLNAAWSPLFFGLHRPGWALIDIVAMAATIAVTTWKFLHIDRLAAALMLPYLMWVSFATLLNFAIWEMN